MAAPKASQGYQGNFIPFVPVNIPGSTKISSIVTTNGLSLVGILIPVGFSGANLTFYSCEFADGLFLPMSNKAGVVTYPTSGAQFIAIDPKDFYGVQFLQIRSDVNEVDERDFFVALKGF